MVIEIVGNDLIVLGGQNRSKPSFISNSFHSKALSVLCIPADHHESVAKCRNCPIGLDCFILTSSTFFKMLSQLNRLPHLVQI